MSLQAHWVIRVGGWFSFACTLVLGGVLFITFDSAPPFTPADGVTTISNQNGARVLVESRGFAGKDTSEMTIYRTFYHKSDAVHHVVAVEGGVVINQKADYVVLRSFVLPAHVTGSWCSTATIYWRPMLSLKQHSFALPDLCFEVPND